MNLTGCILLILLQFVPHQTLSRFQVNQESNQELNQELNQKLNSEEDGAKILLKNGEGVMNERRKVDSGVSCQDEKGNHVDWWIAYKLPQPSNKQRKSGRKNEFINNGTAYTYILSTQEEKNWILSEKSIEDDTSLPGRSLTPLYSGSKDILTLLYNDEHPDGPTSFDLGHTKGLILGDETNSIWLIHSVPHYPPYPNLTYGYPHTGHRYGQSLMCLNIPTSSLDSIGTQLLYNQPYLYGVHLPDWAGQYKALVAAAQGNHVRKAPFFKMESLNTAAGIQLTSFAKSSKFGKDLYADLVAPVLQAPLLVETWPNGHGRMPSRCDTKFIVENVAELNFAGIEDEDFTTQHDHAKWAISLDSKKPYVCVGDINRMDTQTKRGGGTTCMSDSTVWKIFKKCVKNIEPCPRSHKSNKGNLTKHLKKLQTKPWKRNKTKHLKKTQSNSWKMRQTKHMRKIQTKLWKKMSQSKFSPSKHIRGFWKSTRE